MAQPGGFNPYSESGSPFSQPRPSPVPFGQPQTPQATPGLANPWVQQGSPLHTPFATGVNALSAADIAGFFNPNVDPIMDMIRSQAFQDAGGRANAQRLAAQLYGGGDPYLQSFAALQGSMGSQSDLARILGQASLARGTAREQFFQQLLMQMLGGAYGRLGAEAGQKPQFNWGSLLGGLGGAAIGSIFGPAGTAAGGTAGSQAGKP